MSTAPTRTQASTPQASTAGPRTRQSTDGDSALTTLEQGLPATVANQGSGTPVPPYQSSPETGPDYSGYKLVGAKHPWRWVGTVVVALGVAGVAWSLATNPRWEWGVVAQWFTAESVLRGLVETLKLTVISGALGFILGFILAIMRLSASPLLVSVSWTFSWIFRSTPLLVQMLLWYNLGYLYEKISLGIPFTSVQFFEVQTTTLISQFAAAILGLTLNQAAYSAEIIRGGILSVDQGQLEAASALGIPAWRRSTRIVLPQAMRSILPTAFNEIIGLVKGTSIVYVLAYSELFYTVQVIYNRTQQVLPLLLVATLWYIVITSVLSIFQYYIERHFAKGAVRTLPLTPLQKAKKFFSLHSPRAATSKESK